MTIGATDAAKRTLALPVRIGTPSGVTGLVDDIENPSFAMTIGLLLYGSKAGAAEQSFTSRLSIPTGGFAGKITEAIKNLLP